MAEGSNNEEVLFLRGSDFEKPDTELWDDEALIKAYDRAMSLMKPESSEQSNRNKRKNGKLKTKKAADKGIKWKVGDKCQATYTEDGLVYDAYITEIHEDTDSCVVTYSDYGNQEMQLLADLTLPELCLDENKGAAAKSVLEEPNLHRSSDDIKTEEHRERARYRHHLRHHVHHRSPHFHSRAPHPEMHSNLFNNPLPSWRFHQYQHEPFAPSSMGTNLPWNTLTPPPPMTIDKSIMDDNEALHSMLLSWYMSGYHTGYYQALQTVKRTPQPYL